MNFQENLFSIAFVGHTDATETTGWSKPNCFCGTDLSQTAPKKYLVFKYTDSIGKW